MDEQAGGAAPDLFDGTNYRTVRRLAVGGMAEVYLVEHRHLYRPFVAKLLHKTFKSFPQTIDRMRLEAQALARLEHPNVVSVTGFGTSADGRPFLVLEYLKGRTLREELEERGVLPLGEAFGFTLGLLAGLGAAHALGIVHRDIKPANLFLTLADDGERRLKILDFGIARILPGAPEAAPRPLSLPTETGAVIGTPQFLSPEAAAGTRVDARADLYGAALVLYTMVAGRGPFDASAGRDPLREAQAREVPPPSSVAPQPLPRELDGVLLRALARDPENRFPTAEAFAAALRDIAASHGVMLPPPTAVTSVARPRANVASVHPTPVLPPHAEFGTASAGLGRREEPQTASSGLPASPALPTATAARAASKGLRTPILAIVFVASALTSAAAAAELVTFLLGKR